MASATTALSGKDLQAAILKFVKDNKEGLKADNTGYERDHENYKKFDAFFEKACGNKFTTNRGHVYSNNEGKLNDNNGDDQRLAKHGRWELKRLLTNASKPAPAPKPATTEKPKGATSTRGEATTGKPAAANA